MRTERQPHPKIPIGISLCLLGYRVRYNGQSKTQRVLCKDLSPHVEWIGICPEVESGLGVPREPIQLEGNPKRPRVKGVTSRRDVTSAPERTAKKLVSELRKHGIRGFIFKSRSPSCGLTDTPVHGHESKTAGLFARAILQAFPGLPVADETVLSSKRGRKKFLDRVQRWTLDVGR